MTDRTASERLADHVVHLRFDDIPAEAVACAKDLLVYHLGLALRARDTDGGERAVRVAEELSGSDGHCSIIGDRRRADLLEAVFADACLMAELGMDDGVLPGGVHPGVVVQPTAWVVGESCRASGRELLTAVVAGYDVVGKLARTVWTWGWDRPRGPNNVFGPLGAAATAARLFGLSRQHTVHALGHAAHAGMGLIEGSTFQQPYQALLARNGVMAAVLAKAGMAMSPSTIEGRNGLFRSHCGDLPAALTESLATLGEEFEITKARTKRYQASGLNIVPIELMVEMTRSYGLTPTRVARINVALPATRQERELVREADLAAPNHNRIARVGSLRFQLAVIVAEGDRNPSRFDEPPDSALQDLIDRIELRFESARPDCYAGIEVTTTDGARHIAHRDHHVFPPLERNNWLADGSRSGVSERQRARLLALIDDLENLTDVAEVVDCFVPS